MTNKMVIFDLLSDEYEQLAIMLKNMSGYLIDCAKMSRQEADRISEQYNYLIIQEPEEWVTSELLEFLAFKNRRDDLHIVLAVKKVETAAMLSNTFTSRIMLMTTREQYLQFLNAERFNKTLEQMVIDTVDESYEF